MDDNNEIGYKIKSFVINGWKGQATPWKVWLTGQLGGTIFRLFFPWSLVISIPWSIWAVVSLLKCATPKRTWLFWFYWLWIGVAILGSIAALVVPYN